MLRLSSGCSKGPEDFLQRVVGSNNNSWWYSVWQRSWFMYDWEERGREALRHGNLWISGSWGGMGGASCLHKTLGQQLLGTRMH
jgi:hypothetical protein